MIIIEINGGLGNQLQQYSLYEKFKNLGKEVKVDISWFALAKKMAQEEAAPLKPKSAVAVRDLELNYFPGVSYEACTPEEKQSILGSSSILAKGLRKLHLTANRRYTENQMYDEDIFRLDNRVLTGYWACEGYYADILPELRRKLRFPPSDNPANAKMKKKMSETTSVSIHLRRGDYLTPENQALYGNICTDAYYEAAIAHIHSKVGNPVFYVFSDDPAYAKDYFTRIAANSVESRADNVSDKAAATETGQYIFVDINHGKDSFFDMELMSCCRHHICANSTFSFWGARLNGKADRIAIRPLKQRNNVDWYKPEELQRLWKNWVCIDENGILRVE